MKNDFLSYFKLTIKMNDNLEYENVSESVENALCSPDLIFISKMMAIQSQTTVKLSLELRDKQ